MQCILEQYIPMLQYYELRTRVQLVIQEWQCLRYVFHFWIFPKSNRRHTLDTRSNLKFTLWPMTLTRTSFLALISPPKIKGYRMYERRLISIMSVLYRRKKTDGCPRRVSQLRRKSFFFSKATVLFCRKTTHTASNTSWIFHTQHIQTWLIQFLHLFRFNINSNMLLNKTTASASKIASKAMGATRAMSGKEIKFGVEGRAAMLRGVNLLADAVQVS